MSFEAHIGNVMRTCFFQLRQLTAIWNCIPLDTAKTCQLDRLQSVFNAVVRLVCRASRYDHITPLLRDELHWLRCRERITFKLCVTVYKPLHNEVPGYLQELCMPVNMNTRRSTLRSASDDQLIVPRTKTKAGERAFAVAGPLCME